MKPQQAMLVDHIDVSRRFLRSVNLEKDYAGVGLNGDYLLTPTAREVLQRLSEGLTHDGLARAWTLTGPYGIGKSSFAVYLSRVLCNGNSNGHAAQNQLNEVDPQLARRIKGLVAGDAGSKGMLPVLVTARRAPAPQCIAEGIAASLALFKDRRLSGPKRKLKSLLDRGDNGNTLDSRRVVDAIDDLSAAGRSAGYSGVLLIVDELGKLFEYAARYPRRGDVYILQEMAEHAVRSADKRIMMVGLLHQSFEEYGQHLDLATRREWAKIQGRFEDVPFLEPAEQVVRLIGKALRWKKPGLPPQIARLVKKMANQAADCGVVPAGMPKADFLDAALASYPLHPTCLVAMPFLFRRFAQNERSLFSYLSSLEPNAFQDFIRTHRLNPDQPKFIRLSDLFDYFTRNFGIALYRQPHARRWLEAADVLERKEDLKELHRDFVKTVGILNALGEFCHLRASEQAVSFALEDQARFSPEAKAAMALLKEQSVVVFRQFNDTYRIWEGSDVDIEERIAEGRRKVRHGLELADSVQRTMPARSLVARRHSFQTGALRYYQVNYLDRPDDLDKTVAAKSTADGKIVVCLAESGAVADAFRDHAAAGKADKSVLFAIPQQIGDLRSAVTELGALTWVWDNTPDLRDDRVARREVALRITEAEQMLTRNLGSLLDPRPEPLGSGCLWFHEGRPQSVTTLREVSQLLSDVCDHIYPDSPRVRNELIVRRSLSSAASAARRNLIERMLLNAEQPRLGIEGYPPERSMYESVLAATGVHAARSSGTWGFSAPDKKNEHNLLPCWKALRGRVFATPLQPIPVVDLFEMLAAPPFGLREGLHPVILCAFMMAHQDETTLYREGTFIPEPGVADFEVLMRRPELFAVAGCRVAGGRAAVVERLARGLNVSPATVPVVRAMFAMTKGLPEMTWQTRSLTAKTIALRECFQDAKSPEKFLFHDVPRALEVDEFTEKHASQARLDAFFTALNESLAELGGKMAEVVRQGQHALLEACGQSTDPAGWQRLRQQCLELEGRVTESQLLAFVCRVVQATPDEVGVQSVLALVANRPPQSWSDADVERFPGAAEALGRAFRTACRHGLPDKMPGGAYDTLTHRQRTRADALLRKLRTSRLVRDADSKDVLLAALERLMADLRRKDEETA